MRSQPFVSNDLSAESSREGELEKPRGSDNVVTNFDLDLACYHEQGDGRLVIDPQCAFNFFICARDAHAYHREARIEFGEKIAAQLKLSEDGTKVLWPQPTDDPEDPQNVRTDSIIVIAICT